MMTHPLTLTVESAGSEHVISLTGELDLSSIELIRTATDAAAVTDSRTIVFDLERLSFIDSSGVRALMQAQRLLRAGGKVMEVVNAEGAVKRVLEILGLCEVLNVQNGSGSAVQHHPNVSLQSTRA